MVQTANLAGFADIEKEEVKVCVFKQPDGRLLFLTRENWRREDLVERA